MNTNLMILVLALCQICAAQEEELQERLVNDEKQTMKKEFVAKCINVAFGASLGILGNFGPFDVDITLVYRNVYANSGYFNHGTGIFVAPVYGVYYFSFSGHHFSTRLMALQLMKNGNDVITVATHPAGYETATNSMTLTLVPGDNIYIRLLAGTWIYDDINNYSTFTGFLLLPL